MRIICKGDVSIIEYTDYTEEELAGYTPEDDLLKFIGFALHSIQQGQSIKLTIHKWRVEALHMDQTCGEVSLDDLFYISPTIYPYQRLQDVLNNTLSISRMSESEREPK